MAQYNQSYGEKTVNISHVPVHEIMLIDQLIEYLLYCSFVYNAFLVILLTSIALVICLSKSASFAFSLRCFTFNFVFILSLSVRHVYFTLYTFIDR